MSSNGATRAADLLVALHARKSGAFIGAFRKRFPDRPIVVVLTGTDVYGSRTRGQTERNALAAADAIVTLQPLAIGRIPAGLRKKAVAIVQSARSLRVKRAKRNARTRFCVLAHLRPEKDPLRAALALRYVECANVEVIQAGALLDRRYAARIAQLAARDPRYRYVGELSRPRALRLLATSDALILSSRVEGGANVASEAIANRLPVLASRIDGNTGIFGGDYRGYYAAGSSRALAALIARFTCEPAFAAALRRQMTALAPLVTLRREREGLVRGIDCAIEAAARRSSGRW